ncbi:MAG: hypothetical protein AAAC48_22190 [Phyllobacterium sp.]|uniref:hypothetical protein n=1 Tax=Phyllobacterium sp. TaxID=1871046 RepID=UPI0030F2A65D
MQQFRDFLRRVTGMAACSHCIDQFCVKFGVLCFQRLRDLEIHLAPLKCTGILAN